MAHPCVQSYSKNSVQVTVFKGIPSVLLRKWGSFNEEDVEKVAKLTPKISHTSKKKT